MTAHNVYSLTAGQWLFMAVFWALLWALPAFLIRRHATARANPAATYWFWSTLVLLGPLGIFAYWQDRKIRARKGELYPGEREG